LEWNNLFLRGRQAAAAGQVPILWAFAGLQAVVMLVAPLDLPLACQSGVNIKERQSGQPPERACRHPPTRYLKKAAFCHRDDLRSFNEAGPPAFRRRP